jgi:hypothetical protein
MAFGDHLRPELMCGVGKTSSQPHQAAFPTFPFIDVGYWYQFSFTILPDGKIDKYLFPGMNPKIREDSIALDLIADLRGIGHFVARIAGDERTLNRYVFA